MEDLVIVILFGLAVAIYVTCVVVARIEKRGRRATEKGGHDGQKEKSQEG